MAFKIVNGEKIDLTPQELAALNQQRANAPTPAEIAARRKDAVVNNLPALPDTVKLAVYWRWLDAKAANPALTEQVFKAQLRTELDDAEAFFE